MNELKSKFKFEQDINTSATKPQLVQALGTKGEFVAIKYFSKPVISKLNKSEVMRTFAMFNSLRHKYLIHYDEVHLEEDNAYLVMDWCEGKSLFDTLQGYKNLPEKLVSRYICEVLQGLDYLHSQGTTHDNIKASNILTKNGIAILTDFGLSAKISNLDILQHPYWSAPEVLKDKSYSKESDTWSLACTILELLTGKPPFADLSPDDAINHILNDEITQFPDSFSAHLCEFLGMCFKREPSERPSAKDLLSYLWISANNNLAQETHKSELDIPDQLSPVVPNNVIPQPKNLDDIFKGLSDDEDIDLSTNAAPPKEAPKPLLQLNPSKPPLLTLPTNNNANGGGLKPIVPNNPNMKMANLDFLDDDDDDDDMLSGLPSKPQDDKKPPQPAPLILLPKNNAPKGPANLDDLGLSDDDDDNEQKVDVKEGKTLQDFMENSGDEGDIDFDLNSSDQNQEVGLVFKQEVHGPVDFSTLLDENPEEEKILQHSKEVQKLSRKLIKKLKLITTLNSPNEEEQFNQSLDKISEILKKEPTVRASLINQQGILPIIEVIEFSKLKNDKNINMILSIIYDMCKDEPLIKESFCLLGGIPPIIKFLKPDVDAVSRKYAVNVLTEICFESLDNTQMFIACDGLSAICQILKYDIYKEWELIISAFITLNNYFGKQKATQKADLCRLFMKARLFKPMSIILLHFARDEMFEQKEETRKIIPIICEFFHSFSQADTKVKLALSSPDVMENIIRTMYTPKDGVLRVLSLDDTVSLTKAIKYIAMVADTRDNLTDAGVMEMICEMLKYDFGISIHSHLIMLLNSMCKLSSQVSKKRVGIVADSRLLPYLVEYMGKETELKSMTLSVIMELYNVVKTDKVAMKKLINDKLIDIYLSNLVVFFWGSKAINAISSLLNEDQEEIEPLIITDSAIELFRKGIDVVEKDNARTFISRFAAIVRKSQKFVNKLINDDFVQILINKFEESIQKNFAQMETLLLELMLALFQSEAKSVELLKSEKLRQIVSGYTSTDNVKQQTNASKILDYFK